MRNIAVTGSSGFVGKNLLEFYKDNSAISVLPLKLKETNNISFASSIYAVIHLAGIAHDLNNSKVSQDYYDVNSDLTKKVYDAFLLSEARIFIFLSSVKAVTDKIDDFLTEEMVPNPKTDYGKSKRAAEVYILGKAVPANKKVFILRPCMIHGPGNKGNLNVLFHFAKKSFPWPLGLFYNERSFCGIDNLLFVIDELIKRENITPGIYNIADDGTVSTTQLVKWIAKSLEKKMIIVNVPKWIVYLLAKIGDLINSSFNSHSLTKLTENYAVSNLKIKMALGKEFPNDLQSGFQKTFHSFKDKYDI